MTRPLCLKETSDQYTKTVVLLGPRHRIIICRDGIQWIVQRRDTGRSRGANWRALSYCTTRDGLVRALGGLKQRKEAVTLEPLDIFPETLRRTGHD